MEWNEILVKLKKLQSDTDIRLLPPASKDEIQKIEQTLNVILPEELRNLLITSNGVEELMRNLRTNELIVFNHLCWSVNGIISNTLLQYEYLEIIDSKDRTKYLFFSDNGCGESFGYKIQDGKCEDTRIYIYHPIDDEYVIVANNLKEWLEAWVTSEIKT